MSERISPRVESLLCSRWLRLNGEYLPADEHATTLAMEYYLNPPDRLLSDRLPSHIDRDAVMWAKVNQARNIRFSTVLRTGGLFVVDMADIPPDIAARNGDLPPLPFKRNWFEFWTVGVDHPVHIWTFRDLDNANSRLHGIGITELEPCKHWIVYYLLTTIGEEQRGFAVREFSLMAGDGVPTFGTEEDEMTRSGLSDDDRYRWLTASYTLPTALVNMVHCLGVRHEPIDVPRPTRRSWQRKYGFVHPSIYKVDLRSAGDDDGERPYTGKREYHVRWLVRGHYRLAENGAYDVPGKGRCTFVQAHCKGPRGAPWRGRPFFSG